MLTQNLKKTVTHAVGGGEFQWGGGAEKGWMIRKKKKSAVVSGWSQVTREEKGGE